MIHAATARDRVLAALRRQAVHPVPVGAVTQSATVQQMEELSIGWPEAHSDPELMAGLAEGACTLLGFDLARVPFDQTIEAELLGAEIERGSRTSNCSVRSHPLSLGDPLPPFPDLSSGRAWTVVEAISILRYRLGRSAAVIGGIVGPFTLTCQMLEISAVLTEALRHPGTLRPYVDFAVALGAEYARRQVYAGADVICIEDMSASLDLTSPGIYQDIILPAQRRLIAEIKAPVILHICGSNNRILELLWQTGAAALSLENRTDLARAAEGPCAIVGGVPPVEILLSGSCEDVQRASAACLAAGVNLLAPGCGLPPQTPSENLRVMTRAAHDWKR